MATYEYTALGPDGERSTATVEAASLHEASERVRIREGDIESIVLRASRVGDRTPRYEPEVDRPPPAPRDIPRHVKGLAGQRVVVLVGGLFASIAAVLIVTGLAMLADGQDGALFLVLFPMVHFLIGAGLLIWAVRSRLRRRSIYRNGVAAMARIETIGLNRSIQVNGRSPYEIVWTFQVDGQTFHDKRSSFGDAMSQTVCGDRIWVLYDPSDPEESVEWPPL